MIQAFTRSETAKVQTANCGGTLSLLPMLWTRTSTSDLWVKASSLIATTRRRSSPLVHHQLGEAVPEPVQDRGHWLPHETQEPLPTVSYTHLTLPTNREV